MVVIINYDRAGADYRVPLPAVTRQPRLRDT